MQNTKRLTIELIILAIILIGAGGFWYLQSKNISVTGIWNTMVKQAQTAEIKIIDIQKEKIITEENYKNFQRANILDNLLDSEQYKKLQATEVIINTKDGVGNPEPFNKPKTVIKP